MYVDYDEYGLKEVRCMLCDTVVANRTYIEVPKKGDATKTEKVLTMQRLSNWRQPQQVELEDGSYLEPIVCSGCEHEDLATKDIEKKTKQGWEVELEAHGRGKEAVKKHKDRVKKFKIKAGG